jgi:type II secretory pathway pseudopilin PulG
MKRHDFSLVELIAVIVIISVGIGIASVGIRSSSDAAKFEQAAGEFTAFASRARFQAMELGRDRAILYHPAERRFTASDPQTAEEPDENSINILALPSRLRNYETDAAYSEPSNFAALSWPLPEDYELEADGGVLGGDRGQGLEIFRFYADGGGSGSHRFILQFKNLKRVFTISPLTGLMTESAEETP